MIALPNPSVPLADRAGHATQVFQEVMGSLPAHPPAKDAILFADDGTATPILRRFLHSFSALLPRDTQPLVNQDGTPTRIFTRYLAEVTR